MFRRKLLTVSASLYISHLRFRNCFYRGKWVTYLAYHSSVFEIVRWSNHSIIVLPVWLIIISSELVWQLWYSYCCCKCIRPFPGMILLTVGWRLSHQVISWYDIVNSKMTLIVTFTIVSASGHFLVWHWTVFALSVNSIMILIGISIIRPF